MFSVLETITLQRSAIMLASLLGVACCVLAVLDARSQQVDDRPVQPHVINSQAARQDTHRMRGWLPHKGRDPAAPGQRVQAGTTGLG
jgi:hypothetical protein